MRTIDIYNSITMLPDELVDETGAHRFRKKRVWVRWAAAAAAFALVVGIAGAATGRIRLFGANAGTGGGAGGENGYSYMYYVGPVLPLTATDGAAGVTAARHVDFDFSPYATRTERIEYEEPYEYEAWDTEAVVTDRYTLVNGTGEARTLSLLYPVPLTLNDPAERFPTITVDGERRETTLYAGPYAGGFADAKGDHDPAERLNLDQASSWEAYAALLADSRYQAEAFAPAPDLNVPVTVYRVDDYVVAPTDAVNPSLAFFFTPGEQSTVMTYGSNGGSDELGRSYRIVGGLGNEYRPPEPVYIVVMGDDIADYRLQGYANMGGDEGTEIDVTARVTRYETTMEAFLRQIVDDYAETYQVRYGTFGVADTVPREMLYRLAAELLVRYGVLSDDPRERYYGMLEEVFEAYIMRRVLYLAFDVTIPAGGSVEIAATMRRDGSMDYVGNKKNVEGYDMATRLGSTLTFTEQTASVSHTEAVEIVKDNFGFDLPNGVTAVTLDPAGEHYWMQVMKKR